MELDEFPRTKKKYSKRLLQEWLVGGVLVSIVITIILSVVTDEIHWLLFFFVLAVSSSSVYRSVEKTLQEEQRAMTIRVLTEVSERPSYVFGDGQLESSRDASSLIAKFREVTQRATDIPQFNEIHIYDFHELLDFTLKEISERLSPFGDDDLGDAV